MPKIAKTKWLGARVDEDMSTKVSSYIEVTPGMDMAELIRRAVEEYITNHPVREPQEAK